MSRAPSTVFGHIEGPLSNDLCIFERRNRFFKASPSPLSHNFSFIARHPQSSLSFLLLFWACPLYSVFSVPLFSVPFLCPLHALRLPRLYPLSLPTHPTMSPHLGKALLEACRTEICSQNPKCLLVEKSLSVFVWNQSSTAKHFLFFHFSIYCTWKMYSPWQSCCVLLKHLHAFNVLTTSSATSRVYSIKETVECISYFN